MRAGEGGSVDGVGEVGVVRTEAGNGDNGRFRVTLVRVLLVQVVALALLGILQAVYHG